MKALSIVIILVLSWTASFGYYTHPSDTIPVDSTLMYSAPLWIMNNMAFEVQKGRECGELVKFQANEIQKGLNVEIKLNNELHIAQELSAANDQAAAFAKAGENEWQAKYGIQEDITDHYKGQNTNLKVGLGFAILVIIGQTIFGR